LLGTTLAEVIWLAASIALDIIESQNLMENAKIEAYFMEAIKVIPEIIKVKGRGLMLGVEFDFDVSALRKDDHRETYFTQVDLVIKSIANSSAFNNYNYCN
jgi:4-aminobutyrate aminotransferase-like enzyme